MKNEIDLAALGITVIQLRHTKTRSISLAVGKDEEAALAAEKLKVAVEAVFGSETGVRIYCNLLHLKFKELVWTTVRRISRRVLQEKASGLLC